MTQHAKFVQLASVPGREATLYALDADGLVREFYLDAHTSQVWRPVPMERQA